MNTKNTMNTLTAIKNTIAARDAVERALYNTMLSFCFENDTFHENGVCNIIVGNMNSRLDRVTVEPVQAGEQLSIIVSDYEQVTDELSHVLDVLQMSEGDSEETIIRKINNFVRDKVNIRREYFERI